MRAVRDAGDAVADGQRPRVIALGRDHDARRRRRRLTADELLVEADLAMYDAKEAGRDGVPPCSRVGAYAVRIEAAGSIWANRIQTALDHGPLRAARPADRRAAAAGACPEFELLLRMRRRPRRADRTRQFLSIAERFDLIQQIDQLGLRGGGAAARARTSAGRTELGVELNMSGRSLGDPQLLADIERELAAHAGSTRRG